jgi:sphingosine kinase
METGPISTENPFVDPSSSGHDLSHEQVFSIDATLAVTRNGSLTLGTDSLIVLGRPRPDIAASEDY